MDAIALYMQEGLDKISAITAGGTAILTVAGEKKTMPLHDRGV